MMILGAEHLAWEAGRNWMQERWAYRRTEYTAERIADNKNYGGKIHAG